jgi:flavin-dependent dehydrogenase
MTMTLLSISESRYDAIVVGARCAGSATAMLLARAGLKVLAIDRQAYGSDTLSTHALMRGAAMQLHRWGLTDQILESGAPAVRRTSFHYGDEQIDIDIKRGHGVNALFAPRRTVLDKILVDAARAAGATVQHGAFFEGPLCSSGRVVGAVVRDAGGVVRDLRASILIGADGRHSMVAESVGAQKYRKSEHCSAAIYGYFGGLNDEGFRWYYRPGVSVGAIPTNDDASCVFASVPTSRFRGELRQGAGPMFDRIMMEAAPNFAAEIARATLRGKLRGFPGEHGYFRQSFGPGWALVGDAAYFKDPITAHGITDALRDAELLTRAVCDGSERALAHYQEERDVLSADLFRATEEIASFSWDLDRLKVQHQLLNTAMKREVAALSGASESVKIAA